MNAHDPYLHIPQNVEIEQQLLGAVLMRADSYFMASEIIDADCFYESVHSMLWNLVGSMIEGGRRADPITVIAALGKDAANLVTKDESGGMTLKQYVARLAAGTVEGGVGSYAVPDYAKTIRDLAKRRRLLQLGQDLTFRASGAADDTDVEALIEEIDHELGGIRFGQQMPSIKWLHDAAKQALDQTALNYKSRDTIKIGLETGIQELDELIGPLMGGDLITLAAASGHGKTALVTQILCAAATQSLDATRGRPAFFVSQEMQASQIARRVMASWTKISTRKQRAGDVDVSQYEELTNAAQATASIRILFDESGRQKASTIARKARAMKRLHGIGVMAVDHLLLIKPENPKWTQVQTIENAAMVFKDLAKELDIVVFQLAQLTREAQKGTSWRFTDQSLYGGDAIKQASDVMLALSIPVKWLRQRKPSDMEGKEGTAWLMQCQKWSGKAEIGTLKVRDGDDGDWTSIAFDGARMMFGEAR